jgi:GNAT superfamily N-acetyltransferase
VERTEDSALIADLLVAGYGPGVLPRWWFAAPVGAQGWCHFVARLDGHPVGAAALRVGGEAAWLGFAATRPEARGQGVQRALVGQRLLTAEQAGCSIAVSETVAATGTELHPSHRNLEALGFRLAYQRWTWTIGDHEGPRP